jgi:uncharacterized ubiquitin-like protein YukD
MAEITVDVRDMTDNKKMLFIVPDNQPIEKLIEVFIDHFQLPKVGFDGNPQFYDLHVFDRLTQTNKKLNDQNTFSQSGVSEGAILKLITITIAGS